VLSSKDVNVVEKRNLFEKDDLEKSINVCWDGDSVSLSVLYLSKAIEDAAEKIANALRASSEPREPVPLTVPPELRP
jgi:hypothetical protein